MNTASHHCLALKPLDQTLTAGALLLSTLIALSIAAAFEIPNTSRTCQRSTQLTHCPK